MSSVARIEPKDIVQTCCRGHKAVRVVMVGVDEPKPSNVVACHACGITAVYGDRECRGCSAALWRWENIRMKLFYCTDECRKRTANARAKERRKEKKALLQEERARAEKRGEVR